MPIVPPPPLCISYALVQATVAVGTVVHEEFFFLSLMHPIGPELPISAHVASARVCQQLDVLCASHALVQATVGVGTVIIVYIGVAYTRGGGRTTVCLVLHPTALCFGVIFSHD